MNHDARKSSIRTYALIAVGVTSAFLIGLSIWLTIILSGRDWCDRALGATIVANKSATGDTRPEYAVSGCFNLLRIQVEALALNSHIAVGIIGLSLAVLVVIVLAGGRVQFSASKDGASANIGADEAADQVAAAAVDEAENIKGTTP